MKTDALCAWKKIENDISHQLIEECMLAANEVVARELKQRKIPSVYRIHEDPDPEKLLAFRDIAAAYGFRAGNLTQRSEVQKLLAAIKGAPEEQALKIGFLKSLKRAAYDINPIGHYGLSKVNYTHFTSPIRRYADLVVHRSLADLVSPPKMGAGESQIERAPSPPPWPSSGNWPPTSPKPNALSADAERDSGAAQKNGILPARQLGATAARSLSPPWSWMSGPTASSVELPSVSMSGLVHVSDLPDDFYVFDPRAVDLFRTPFWAGLQARGRACRPGVSRASSIRTSARLISFSPRMNPPPPRTAVGAPRQKVVAALPPLPGPATPWAAREQAVRNTEAKPPRRRFSGTRPARP